MKYVYVVYEYYTRDFMNLNDITKSAKYLATLETEHDMITYIDNEVKFQCSNNDEDDTNWTFKRVINNDTYAMMIYYGSELQYKIIGKEVVLDDIKRN